MNENYLQRIIEVRESIESLTTDIKGRVSTVATKIEGFGDRIRELRSRQTAEASENEDKRSRLQKEIEMVASRGEEQTRLRLMDELAAVNRKIDKAADFLSAEIAELEHERDALAETFPDLRGLGSEIGKLEKNVENLGRCRVSSRDTIIRYTQKKSNI